MAAKKKGVIGILTGGGDVPGLNPAIRAVTIRALREGWQVIGFRRGWGGLVDRGDRQSCGAHRRYLPAYLAHQAEFGQEVERPAAFERPVQR